MSGVDSEQGGLNGTAHANRRAQVAPDVRQHDLEELLGGKDPLTPAGRGAVQGACGCHHAVGAAQVSLAALTQTVCWQNHLMTAVFVHQSLQAWCHPIATTVPSPSKHSTIHSLGRLLLCIVSCRRALQILLAWHWVSRRTCQYLKRLQNAVVLAGMRPHQKAQVVSLLGAGGLHQVFQGGHGHIPALAGIIA